MIGRHAVAIVALCGAACTLSSLHFLHSSSGRSVSASGSGSSSRGSSSALRASAATATSSHSALALVPSESLSSSHSTSSMLSEGARKSSMCDVASHTSRAGIVLRVTDPHDETRAFGDIRLILRPEWTSPSASFASKLAAQDASLQASTVYRLEPGFLIQGRLGLKQSGLVPPNRDNTRAAKVMERGEVGWAGGSTGPDWFIYLGMGPAGWLGNPHEGTVWAEVADEQSMAVANNVSLVPVPPTAPGQMHTLRSPLRISASPWTMPPDALDLSRPVRRSPENGGGGSGTVVGSSSGGKISIDGGALGVLKIGGVSRDEGALACNASCHVLPRTELHGGVVRWGDKHLMPNAAACCAACLAAKGCNVWVWCGSRANCAGRYAQCWLKRASNLWADKSLLVGTNELWTSGTIGDPPPEDHPSGAGRRLPMASEAQVALILSGGGGTDPSPPHPAPPHTAPPHTAPPQPSPPHTARTLLIECTHGIILTVCVCVCCRWRRRGEDSAANVGSTSSRRRRACAHIGVGGAREPLRAVTSRYEFPGGRKREGGRCSRKRGGCRSTARVRRRSATRRIACAQGIRLGDAARWLVCRHSLAKRGRAATRRALAARSRLA